LKFGTEREYNGKKSGKLLYGFILEKARKPSKWEFEMFKKYNTSIAL